MKYFLWIDEKQTDLYGEQEIREMILAGAITTTTLGHAEDETANQLESSVPANSRNSHPSPPSAFLRFPLKNGIVEEMPNDIRVLVLFLGCFLFCFKRSPQS